ncbi:MAG: hypothetical protein KY464_10810 [Gemmatimonadetes bacterium]|nr:hypothetical protein [Gemmatimonadota bacterium]
MTRPLPIVIGVTLLGGLAADAAWGTPAGVGVAAYVSAMGLAFIILQRNQQHLSEVKDELADRRAEAMRRRACATRPGETGSNAREASRLDARALHGDATMERVLRLEGPELDLIVQGMWRRLLDHTRCVQSTAHILEQIAQARQFGRIDHCLVFQVKSRSPGAASGAPEWALRVVHAPV